MIFSIKDFEMTLFEIVNILKQIALTQPNVKSATDGSIYDIMNATNSVKYDVVHLSQTKHITDEETDTYGFNIFYVSRLEDSLEDNRLQIQSIGKEVLDNILRTFCENWGIDYPEIIFYPFTQKFADLCAGCYCRVEIEVPKDLICADDYIGEIVPSEKDIRLQDVSVTITENGTRVITPAAGFDGIGEITITTDVSGGTGRLEYKEVEYTENGEYTVRPSSGYDGLSEVAISISVPQGQGYEEGYEDGVADQKAKLSSLSVSANGQYDRSDGYSAVTVDVPSRYNEGYADGEAAQKAKLVATSFTENSAYTSENGWSSVTVNVSAATDRDLIANLQGDYYLIPSGTTHLRDYAFFECTGLTSIAIPDSVTAIGRNAFSHTSLTGVTIPSGVTIINDETFSSCRELTNVNLPSGITDIGRAAFASCSALTEITIPSGVTSNTNNTFINCNHLTSVTFEGNGISVLGMATFMGCSALTGITLPDSITEIGVGCFSGCSALTHIVIPSGVTVIENQCFKDCTSLLDIVIPSSVTRIDNSTFAGCSGLTAMTFASIVPPTLQSISGWNASLGSTDYTFPIYVPCESLDAYKTAFGTAYAPRIQCAPEYITSLELVVDSAITDSGTATTTYSPAIAITDIYYTSSDPSLATIDSGTGVITVLSSGTITICAIDSITHLQDCKVVAVIKTIPGPTEIPYTADTSDIAATGETRCVTIDTTDLDTSTISLTYTGATGVTYVVNGDQVCITFPNNTGLQRTFIVEITADTLSGGSAYANIVFNQLSDIQTKWLTITYRPSCENPRTYIRSLVISNGKGSYDMVTDGQKLVTGNVTGWTGDTTYLNNVTLYFHLTGNSINADEFARGHYSETGNTAAIASVVVPYGVRTIGARAFSGQYRTYGTLDRPSYCGFSAITLPNTITSIGESAFANCRLLRNINLGDLTGLTQIATSAFDGMNHNGPAAPGAPNIVVPSGVRTIGRRAFASARLTSIVIPASVTAISDYGINIMSGGTAKSFTFLGTTPPTLGCCNFSWFGEGEEYHIYVPASAVNTYKTAWPTEADHITAITP